MSTIPIYIEGLNAGQRQNSVNVLAKLHLNLVEDVGFEKQLRQTVALLMKEPFQGHSHSIDQ
jgi:hypothetical protein